MGYYRDISDFNYALSYIISHTARVYLCSQAPTTYTEASATYALAACVVNSEDWTDPYVPTPADGYAIALWQVDCDSASATGTATHIALCGAASELHMVIPCAEISVTSGQPVVVRGVRIRFTDPLLETSAGIPSGTYVSDIISDIALTSLREYAARIHICSAEPTTYEEATSTYLLTTIRVSDTDFDSIIDGTPNGRSFTMRRIDANSAVSSGTGVYLAVSNVEAALYAVRPCNPVAITSGKWTGVRESTVRITDPLVDA